MTKRQILILSCNFVGLTTTRNIHAILKEQVDITIIGRKALLTLVPNMLGQVMANVDPAKDL